jgi:hypothetical protein
VYFGLDEFDIHFDNSVLNELQQYLELDFPRVRARVRAWLYRDRVRETVTRAVEDASRTAEDSYFARYVLPHCKHQQVISILMNLVDRRMWQSVSELLRKREQYKLLSETKWEMYFQWAIKEAARTASNEDIIKYIAVLCGPKQLTELLLPWIIDFEKWEATRTIVHQAVAIALRSFQLEFDLPIDRRDKDNPKYIPASKLLIKEGDDTGFGRFWFMIKLLRLEPGSRSAARFVEELMNENVPRTYVTERVTNSKKNYTASSYKMSTPKYVHSANKIMELNDASEKKSLLVTPALLLLCSFVCGPDQISRTTVDYGPCNIDQPACEKHVHATAIDISCKEKRSVLPYIAQTVQNYMYSTSCGTGISLDEAKLLTLNALCSVFSVKDTFTVKAVLQYTPSNTTSLWACAEDIRRKLFQQAVRFMEWSVVKRWADHTLYEDERWWALQEAYKHKQWDVMLQLAEHGLTDAETMLIRKQLVESGDWSTVLHMLDRGVDITEIKAAMLKALSKRAQRNLGPRVDLETKCRKVLVLHDALYTSISERQKTEALSKRRWRRVFFYLQRSFDTAYHQRALEAAIQSKTWRVVIPLLKLGTTPAQRDSLFTWMTKHRRWGVCKALLEQGVSVQLCLYTLPELMKMSQWILVARVMEFDVGDVVRQEVMRRAIERREGSVVWRCINTMQHHRLSKEDRETLFQQAFYRGM